MAVEKITIKEFLELSDKYPVLDVRSPGEYQHAHFPGAYSFPLFTDEERKVVGTTYKQESKQEAIRTGLGYFGKKMVQMVDEAEQIVTGFTASQIKTGNDSEDKRIIVHCWRGGMRSAGVAWLLDLYGFKVYTLVGGYKVFRKWVLQQFEAEYAFKVIGGYTGSGKTEVLHALCGKGAVTIDFEALAHHRGSAFGSLGQPVQPSQEMFENKLAIALFKATIAASQQEEHNRFIWVEDESQRIGDVNLPGTLYRLKQSSPICFLDIPFDERAKHITKGYGHFEKEKLINAIIRIKKRLGPLETKKAVNYLLEDDIGSCFAVLLKYYDKWYSKSLEQRPDLVSQITKIACNTTDSASNAEQISNLAAMMA